VLRGEEGDGLGEVTELVDGGDGADVGDEVRMYCCSARALASSTWWLSISEVLGIAISCFPRCSASRIDPEPAISCNAEVHTRMRNN
jgi:hypothetical protein